MDFLIENISIIVAVVGVIVAVMGVIIAYLAFARPSWMREGKMEQKLQQLSEADKEHRQEINRLDKDHKEEIRRLSDRLARVEADNDASARVFGEKIQNLKEEIKDMRIGK